MNRRSRFVRSGLMSGVGALIAGAAFLIAPSQGALASTGCSDCWIVTPAGANPATVGPGTGQVYSFTVTNNDPNETLQKLTFTAPTDFVITDAKGPSRTTPSALPASSVTLTLPSNAGSPFNVYITALAPCAQGSEMWGLSDMDSLDNNEAQWSSSPLSVSVQGHCGLRFSEEPAQTAVNSPIRAGFNSTVPDLKVQLLDAKGNALNAADSSASNTQVTISFAANPGGGTLSGNTASSSNGIADFTNPQIDKAGVGYELVANATGFTTSVTSSPFTVTGQIQACDPSCSASQSTSTTVTSASTSSQDNFLALGLGGVTLACNHYKAVSDVADFGILNPAGGSVATASASATLTISASAVASSPRPLILWQVCYGSPTPFPVIPGTSGTTVIGGTTYHTGLLLPCILFPPAHTQPCLISQRYTATGGVQLTFVAFGDPLFRG
jgi:hypothetical protein